MRYLAIAAVAAAALLWSAAEDANSIGIAMVRIEPGAFQMGVDSTPLDAALIQGISGSSYDRQSAKGDWQPGA